MPRRKGNGEGSVYQRKDGRYEAAAWVLSTRGTRKRLRIYASTRGEAQVSLRAALAQSDRGVPVPLHAWTVGEFLQHWLEDVVRINRRPRTYELYESTIRLHLLPGLGKHSLTRLSVSQVQSFLNAQSDAGKSVRTLHLIRGVLRAALARAVREELLSRNVARLVELPTWQRADIRPWSADEAVQFLQATHDAALHPVYLLLLTYGLRRGEVLGVRWEDVDVAQGQLHIRQQVQRYEGKLHVGPVKTNAGRRDLPLVPMVAEALARRRAALDVVAPGALVFTSRTGQPIEPGNLVRTFKLACVHHGYPQSPFTTCGTLRRPS